MGSWATLSNVVNSCRHPPLPYPRRLEKVKFGVPLEEVCKNDIPGPLLVLILKLNKEAPVKKNVFRAPGHQGSMKKLVHFLQSGHLVNMDNYSVHTIASVLKKFLRKIPGGIFGKDNEQQLFSIVDLQDSQEQREQINKLITSLPCHTQRLLVLLFGTFRVIASNAERFETGMTSEALGVSVAPSFFQSCVSDGKPTATMDDVMRFKVATRIMKLMIDNFGACNLFGRPNYEFYARITGRILKVEDDWIFSFKYPPDSGSPISQQEESQSTPALLHLEPSASSSLGIIPETNLLESCTRLSISLEENGLFKASSRSSSSSNSVPHMTLEELRAVNRYAESTKSLSYLPQELMKGGDELSLARANDEGVQVHERQAARMRTRSEWFLNPGATRNAYSVDSDPTLHVLRGNNTSLSNTPTIGLSGLGLSASAESVSKKCVRRNSSRSRHQRASLRRNKENGSKRESDSEIKTEEAAPPIVTTASQPSSQTIQIKITYKPRI